MTQIQLRRDTANNWQTANPILAQGEVGIDLTNKLIKIGDGATAWNNLNDYAGDYNDIFNKPQINNIVLSGNKTGAELGLQNTLTAGDGITIEDNVISATGGSAPANMVTTNTIQTITANKKLADDVEFQIGSRNNARIYWNSSQDYPQAFGAWHFSSLYTNSYYAANNQLIINATNSTTLTVGVSNRALTLFSNDAPKITRNSNTYVNIDSGNLTSTLGVSFWTGTQAEYDGITTKDENTLYIITGA